MRNAENVFHLAIPCEDLNEAEQFYVQTLGCQLARKYADRITLNFFGDQVVCHLDPNAIDPDPKPYPRHFGVTFRHRADFDRFTERVVSGRLPFFQEVQERFAGKRERHMTFMLKDPSNNILEFKWYNDPEMIY